MTIHIQNLLSVLFLQALSFPVTSSFILRSGSAQITHRTNTAATSASTTSNRPLGVIATGTVGFGTSSIQSYSTGASATYCGESSMKKPRILCLHGKSQSGAILSNKIKGATRKLTRVYDLEFLDGPILEAPKSKSKSPEGTQDQDRPHQYAWWIRNEKGRDILVQECFEYVLDQTKDQQYDAVLGFSQGGLLATALVSSGKLPGVKAVVTAGAPFVQDAWDFAFSPPSSENNGKEEDDDEDEDKEDCKHLIACGMAVPKLHFAGETDAVISVERVEELCDKGGNGTLVLHEKGHMFPTKAVSVNKMMKFLRDNISTASAGT